MLPNSPEWNAVRNNIYAELRNEKYASLSKMRKESGQTTSENSSILDLSSFHNLLIVNHDDIDSYQTLNILNYFGFPIHVEEEDFWSTSRKQFAFSKTDAYPFLVINSSHEEMPNCDIAGKENILSFLFNKSLISSYRTYGVYE